MKISMQAFVEWCAHAKIRASLGIGACMRKRLKQNGKQTLPSCLVSS